MVSTPDVEERLEARWEGRAPFAGCLDWQLAAREALVEGSGGPQLQLVEHPPTVTLGRRADPEDVLWSPERMAARGLSVCATPRGGEATLHAPGQLVCYPVVHVGRYIRAHIVRLAEVTMTVLGEVGVTDTEFRMETPGVFTPAGKIASIGIHVSRGVTVQGISINLDVDASLFASLVSCGMPTMPMVSVAGLTGTSPEMPALARRWGQVYAKAAGMTLRWTPGAAP